MTSASQSQLQGELVSVNIGTTQEVEHNGRLVRTGIYKTPTNETQQVAGVHIGADEQADTAAHGGEHKAIYAYAAEDYDWWAAELEPVLAHFNVTEPIGAALFGENLTTSGIEVTGANVGDRWHIGSTVLEVSEPRVPCFKLSIRTGIARFQQLFAQAGRPGAYLRIVSPGAVTVGDRIEVEPTTEPTISVGDIASVYYGDSSEIGRILEAARLSDPWKKWAQNRPRPRRA